MGRRAVVRVQGLDGPPCARAGRSANRSRSRPTTATTRRGCIRACSRSPTARRSRCRRCSPCTPSRCSAKTSCSATAGAFRCCRSCSTSPSCCRCRRIRPATPRSTSSSTPIPVRRFGWVSPPTSMPISGPRSSRAGGAISSACSSYSARTLRDELQAVLKPWLARRTARAGRARSGVAAAARGRRRVGPTSRRGSRRYASTYWAVLDSLNAIPVKAGDVDLQRESARASRRRAATPSLPKCTRSATPRAAACSRSRFAARARRFGRGTTCVFRCATSTSTQRSRR